MPYEIVKVGRDSYNVCEPDSSKCVYKKGVSLEKAKAKQQSLYGAERKKRGKQLDSVSNMPTGNYTAVISKDAMGKGSLQHNFTGTKRDVANHIARITNEPATSILNRISAKGMTTFGQPVKVVVTPAGMEGAGIFDWLKQKSSQVFAAAKSGLSTVANNIIENKPATTSDFGDRFLAEQTKLFSPSGRPDEPGIPIGQVIQNFQPNQYMPNTKTLYQMNKSAYANSNNNIENYVYVSGTPTIKIYNVGSAMIVAVRGTADKQDLITDITIAAQLMQDQPRYIQDKQFLQQFATNYPTSQYTYLMTGHSLGGAVCDQLMRDGIGLQAICFNPAVQKAFYDSQNNKRIYQADDPLYRMMGRYCKYNVEVRGNRQASGVEKALSFVPGAGVGYTAMQAHSLDNYVGGFLRMGTSIADRPHLRPLSSPFQSSSKMSGGAKPTNLELYDEAKSIVYPRYDKPSAYRSGALQKEYKRLGGTYTEDGDRPLERWFKEKWTDVGNEEYPVYRPTKRVSKKTPLTASEISPASLRKQTALKQQIRGEENLPPFER